jgi:hypothetical protein
MAIPKKDKVDSVRPKMMPTSKEVAKAAYSPEATLKLVNDYRLSAVEVSDLLRRLESRPVPW